MAPETIGRYEIGEQVGAGGFATVYRAHDPVLERDVALKVLHPHLAIDPDLRQRFVREGRALARVRHPNIVVVYDAGESDGRVYLAMEFVPGLSLAQMAQGQPLPPDLVLNVLRQVAPALDAVHEAGLVHRDVKPANILIEQPGWRRAVLLDLGIARSMDSGTLTGSGVLIGTPGFLSPEQVDGEIPAGPAVDIYQLGATAYALLAGRPPFEGDTAQVLYSVVHRAPPDLRSVQPGVPPHFAAAIDRALSKDPKRRFARASEMVAAIESVPVAATAAWPGAGEPTVTNIRPLTAAGWDGATAVRNGQPGGTPRGDTRRPVWLVPAAIAGALLLGGAGYAAYAATRDDGTPATQLVRSVTALPSASSTAAPPNSTATATPSPTRTPTPSPAPTPSRTPIATPAVNGPSGQLKLPTEAAGQIPIPNGVTVAERAVISLINRNGSVLGQAVRAVDDTGLKNVFTGEALQQYTRYVAELKAKNQYEIADLVQISLTDLRFEGTDTARAKTVEVWTTSRFQRPSNRKVSGQKITYTEEYVLVRSGPLWLIKENDFQVVNRSDD